MYRAWDPRLEREVALKVLSAAANPERFRREAQAMAQVTHPNIVKIHANGCNEAGRPWLAMELVEGPSLSAKLEELRVLPCPEALRLTRSLAAALAELHRGGLLHRDLKPENVLLRRGEPLLADFGLARDESAERLTRTGQILGTPGYAAPELLQGRADEIGTPADVYGLGATLYAMLTGAPPLAGQTLAEVLVATTSTPPVAPRELNPAVSPALSELCLRCLEKSPAERPTLDALVSALAALEEPVSRGRFALGVGVGALVVACLAGGGWLARGSAEPGSQPSESASHAASQPLLRPSRTHTAPPDLAPTLGAVERRFRARDPEGARRIVARALADVDPESVLARILQARVALSARDHAALEATLAPIASGASGGFADYLRARSLTERRNHKGALAALERAIDADPQPVFLLERARAGIRLKRWEQAQADLAALKGEQPQWFQAEAEEARALLCLQLGQIQRGLEIVRALIARHGPETRYGLLGRLLEAEGKDPLEARRALEVALQTQPRNLRIWTALIRLSIRSGDPTDLESVLDRAEAIPRPTATHRNVCSLGRLWLAHLEGRRPQQIRDQLGKVRARGSAAQLLAGLLWRALEREPRAKQLFERVAQCDLPLHVLEAKRLLEPR